MQHVDRVADVEPLPPPTGSSGPRVHHDPRRFVLRSDVAHGVGGSLRRTRNIRHDATIRTTEAKLTVGLSIDPIALLVDGPVVAAAEQHEVREGGGPALCPVSDVVGLAEAAVATREAAAAVPMKQRAPQRRRDRARLGPDLEDSPVRIVPHRHPTRVAARRWDVSAETRAPSSTTDWPG